MSPHDVMPEACVQLKRSTGVQEDIHSGQIDSLFGTRRNHDNISDFVDLQEISVI